jgi:isoleucyl-tRNA synthetase
MPHAESDKAESVFLNDMPAYDTTLAEKTADLSANWEKLFLYRDDVMKALELARANKMIGKSLDAKVTVYANDDEAYNILTAFADNCRMLFARSCASRKLSGLRINTPSTSMLPSSSKHRTISNASRRASGSCSPACIILSAACL